MLTRFQGSDEPLELLPGMAKEPDPYANVAMCVAVKSDPRSLREWILYHNCLGVQKFYMYDDRSSMPLLAEISDFVRSGLVSYQYVDVGQPIQVWAYNDCEVHARGRHQWLVNIDTDEFIVLRKAAKATDLREFLSRYEDEGCLAIQWRVFGSSGNVLPPKGGVLRNYYRCQGDVFRHVDGTGIKTIAHVPKGFHKWVNAHTVAKKYQDRSGMTRIENCVDTVDRQSQFGVQMKQSGPEGGALRAHDRTQLIQLHHYTVKSLSEFQEKINRGGGDGIQRERDYLYKIDQQCQEWCWEGVLAGQQCFGILQFWNAPRLYFGMSAIVEDMSVPWEMFL